MIRRTDFLASIRTTEKNKMCENPVHGYEVTSMFDVGCSMFGVRKLLPEAWNPVYTSGMGARNYFICCGQ